MTDWPASPPFDLPLHISSLDLVCGTGGYRDMSSTAITPASGTWVSGLAVYAPISIPWPYPVTRLWWVNGGTITSTAADMGIYGEDGTCIVTAGQTNMVGASSVQYANPVPYSVVLPPGQYYFGWSCNNTTARGFFATRTATEGRTMGVIQQSSALPLPTTALTAASYGGQGVPFCGITRTASGF